MNSGASSNGSKATIGSPSPCGSISSTSIICSAGSVKRLVSFFIGQTSPPPPSSTIPHIVLPVRTERSTFEELLASFIEAIDYYFAWICNEISDGYTPNYDEVEEILQAYLRHRYADRTFSFGTLSSILEKVPDRYCIEIEFRLKDHPKYCSCWMGNTVDEGKASFWYGLVPDGSEAHDYPDLASFSSAPVFDGKTLEEVWEQIELISIDSCDPIERMWMLL